MWKCMFTLFYKLNEMKALQLHEAHLTNHQTGSCCPQTPSRLAQKRRQVQMKTHLYVCPVISLYTITQSIRHLASKPEFSVPSWRVLSLPRFLHCNEAQTTVVTTSVIPCAPLHSEMLTFVLRSVYKPGKRSLGCSSISAWLLNRPVLLTHTPMG